ncbi:MAG: tyrosine-type recombinase/integrase, partial [Mycobacteriaceae bacterium]
MRARGFRVESIYRMLGEQGVQVAPRTYCNWKTAAPSARTVTDAHLAAADVAALLKAAEGLRYRPVLALIAATGLRRGEALALRWEHVNLKDGTLRVASTLSR